MQQAVTPSLRHSKHVTLYHPPFFISCTKQIVVFFLLLASKEPSAGKTRREKEKMEGWRDGKD